MCLRKSEHLQSGANDDAVHIAGTDYLRVAQIEPGHLLKAEGLRGGEDAARVRFAYICRIESGEKNKRGETEKMEAREIIEFIGNAEKKTPVKVYVKESAPVDFAGCQVFGSGDKIVFGDWADIKKVLDENAGHIEDFVVENDCRNSAIPLLDLKDIKARIESGAIIRDKVEIGDNAVIMMGAVINIGAVIGEGTMIDTGAVLGGRSTVGKKCHIGAGTVLAGVIEPPSAQPVIVEDGVVIGANAVVLEGCRIGKGAVVAAGAVVVEDVAAGVVVAGVPARVIKDAADTDAGKIEIVDLLRKL